MNTNHLGTAVWYLTYKRSPTYARTNRYHWFRFGKSSRNPHTATAKCMCSCMHRTPRKWPVPQLGLSVSRNIPVTHWTGCSVGPRFNLDVVENTKTCRCRETNSESQSSIIITATTKHAVEGTCNVERHCHILAHATCMPQPTIIVYGSVS